MTGITSRVSRVELASPNSSEMARITYLRAIPMVGQPCLSCHGTGIDPAVTARIAEVAGLAGAKLLIRGQDWDAATYEGQLHYRDEAGKLAVSLPRLVGIHQHEEPELPRHHVC